jgi:hypothetical protein
MQVRTWAGSMLAAAVTGATALLYGAGPANALTVLGTLGFSAIALVFVRRWLAELSTRLADTTEERRKLNEETAKCQVAHLANLAFRDRLRADAIAAEVRIEQRIANGIAAVRREFEESRTLELCEAYEEGAMNERNGVHGALNANRGASLIYLADRRPPQMDRPTVRGTGITP